MNFLQRLAACRTLGTDSENRPRRDQFLPGLPPHSPAMGQKAGEKWAGAVGLQPVIPKSDRLPGRQVVGDSLRERVIEALRDIHDPEIPINIYDLGLIYGLDIDDMGRVEIRMTLTAPGCPVAQTFPALVEDAVELVYGVSRATVELVWDPPWDRSCLSEAARLQLGLL